MLAYLHILVSLLSLNSISTHIISFKNNCLLIFVMFNCKYCNYGDVSLYAISIMKSIMLHELMDNCIALAQKNSSIVVQHILNIQVIII
jgi:hypothetical protein